MLDAQTKEALEKSIAHWQRLIDGEPGEYPYGSACDLCKVYRLRKGWCDGCPVFAKTGKHGCGGTAYLKAYAAWRAGDKRSFHKHATEMLDFLISLRDPVPFTTLDALTAKIRDYETTLNHLAAWQEGEMGSHMDEPSAARHAREVLRKYSAEQR
jgi:hypothetical protein